MQNEDKIEIWGGLECTINRVKNDYFDQSEYNSHYERPEDIDLVATLGIKTLRFPILWEKHEPELYKDIDWSFTDRSLSRLRELNIEPIAGLVHHGSGPSFVNFFDGSFEKGVEAYAKKVAERYPWITYYTPVNEPLTTARFCGLYGHWYPHRKDDTSFYKILLSECRAIIMAMRVIRKINPDAKLVQTEDLSKAYSTPLLQYQADLENKRRWLSYDLLCGRVNKDHSMWHYLTKIKAVDEKELLWFVENHCTPDICGFNFYITSERFLDENLEKYAECYHGGNEYHNYADIETVLAQVKDETGIQVLLKEAAAHLQLPLAITECHLHSTREDQMRWFYETWKTVNKLKSDGLDIRAITSWALFGLHGWNKLVTEPRGVYEPGAFNVSSGKPRPTALASLLKQLTGNQFSDHPVLHREGWWKRTSVRHHGKPAVVSINAKSACRPLLIIGNTGTLGNAFAKICEQRNIHFVLAGRNEIDITNPKMIESCIAKYDPWAIINAAGYVQVDRAEEERDLCYAVNVTGPANLAHACKQHGIRFVSYSSDLVFDGTKQEAYVESDAANPMNVYGSSKTIAENNIINIDPSAIVIRTGNFFGPWDKYNFVTTTLSALKDNRLVIAADDIIISPTYVPDLVNVSLDLLMDEESGIFHIANEGSSSWADWACTIAERCGFDTSQVIKVNSSSLNYHAQRPLRTVMKSEKGIKLQSWEDALSCYFDTIAEDYSTVGIAV